MATPRLRWCEKNPIKDLLGLADMPDSGQLHLYDGRTVMHSDVLSQWATCTC